MSGGEQIEADEMNDLTSTFDVIDCPLGTFCLQLHRKTPAASALGRFDEGERVFVLVLFS